MKHFIILFAVFFFFPLLLCFPAEPAATPESDFEWHINNDGNVSIIFYRGRSPDIVIPERIRGYLVTGVESNAFRLRGLASVVLPDTITHIGARAFSGNSLQDISLPENLLVIEGYAFASNELSSITIPEKVTRIDAAAFAFNPLEEVIITSETLNPMPRYAFHRDLPGFLPPGRYLFLGKPDLHDSSIINNDVWFFQNADGSSIPMRLYYENLANDDKSVLSNLMYAAINGRDFSLLIRCVRWGADVNGRIFDDRNPQGNTPLALVMSGFRQYDSRGWGLGMAEHLMRAGAVPQYWMLSFSYYHPRVTRALLEHGVLTTPESSEYGDPPGFYERPESLLLFYSLQLEGKEEDTVINGSAEALLEYGEDANYRDPLTGQTPLGVALNSSHHSESLVDTLLKNMTRPLSLDEYRLMIRRNKEKNERLAYWNIDKNSGGRIDYDVRILEDIQKGILDPGLKDEEGWDIFYYAATTGTVDLMEGLMPYLIETGRLIPAADETSLYIDAFNAGNIPAAAVIFSATDHADTFIKDDSGNEYSVASYAYDYETIYDSAQTIPEFSLYKTGHGETNLVGSGEFTIHYRANEFYTIGFDRYRTDNPDLLLHTVEGAILNLGEIINKEREQYYSKSGNEKPNNVNPEWHIVGIFGNILFVYNNSEVFLIDISSTVPSVYIMDDKDIKFRYSSDYIYAWNDFLNDGVMDFVLNQDRDKAYLIKNSGEVLVFNVGADTIQFEQTLSWRDCRISGWKDGERVFAADGTVEAYDFATGTVRSLGTRIEIPRERIFSNFLYEDEQVRRFIVEAKTGKTYPEPDVDYYHLRFFESGYSYTDEKSYYIVFCYLEDSYPKDTARPEDARLKRKLVLSGEAIRYSSFSLYTDRDEIYFNTHSLVFTIDTHTGQVNKAFNTQHHPYSNNSINVYMFPFGADDIVYTKTVYGGK